MLDINIESLPSLPFALRSQLPQVAAIYLCLRSSDRKAGIQRIQGTESTTKRVMAMNEGKDLVSHDMQQALSHMIERAAESIANYLITERKQLTESEIEEGVEIFTRLTGMVFGGDNANLLKFAIRRRYEDLEGEAAAVRLSEDQKDVLIQLLNPQGSDILLGGGVGPALSRTLKRLEKRGLVVRESTQHKRRTSHIKLTPLGTSAAKWLQQFE